MGDSKAEILHEQARYGGQPGLHSDFEQALIVNTNFGSDNCHRGAVLGAIRSAALGPEAIPNRRLNGLIERERYRRLVAKARRRPPAA